MFSLASSLFLVVALIIVSYYDSDCATGGAGSISVLRALKQKLKGKRSIYSLSLPSSDGNTNTNDAHAGQNDLDKRFLPGLTANWEDKRLFEPISEEVEEEEDQHRKKREGEDDDFTSAESVEMPWRPDAKRSSSSACKDKDKGRRFLLQAGCKKDDYKLCECYSDGFARCTECKYNKASFGKKWTNFLMEETLWKPYTRIM